MLIYPNFYCDNVREVKYEFLKENNIKGIILDVDNTLIDYYRKFEDGTLEWVDNLKKQGLKFCIVSLKLVASFNVGNSNFTFSLFTVT